MKKEMHSNPVCKQTKIKTPVPQELLPESETKASLLIFENKFFIQLDDSNLEKNEWIQKHFKKILKIQKGSITAEEDSESEDKSSEEIIKKVKFKHDRAPDTAVWKFFNSTSKIDSDQPRSLLLCPEQGEEFATGEFSFSLYGIFKKKTKVQYTFAKRDAEIHYVEFKIKQHKFPDSLIEIGAASPSYSGDIPLSQYNNQYLNSAYTSEGYIVDKNTKEKHKSFTEGDKIGLRCEFNEKGSGAYLTYYKNNKNIKEIFIEGYAKGPLILYPYVTSKTKMLIEFTHNHRSPKPFRNSKSHECLIGKQKSEGQAFFAKARPKSQDSLLVVKRRTESAQSFQNLIGKEGYLSKLVDSSSNTWEKYFFKLKHGVLLCFDEFGKQQYTIPTATLKTPVSQYQPEVFDSCFEIVSLNNPKHNMTLKADTVEDMLLWLNMIVCQKLMADVTVEKSFDPISGIAKFDLKTPPTQDKKKRRKSSTIS